MFEILPSFIFLVVVILYNHSSKITFRISKFPCKFFHASLSTLGNCYHVLFRIQFYREYNLLSFNNFIKRLHFVSTDHFHNLGIYSVVTWDILVYLITNHKRTSLAIYCKEFPCTILLWKTHYFSHKTKSAKPVLCQKFNDTLNFTRIASAILVGTPLLYEHFPSPQKKLCCLSISITLNRYCFFHFLWIT